MNDKAQGWKKRQVADQVAEDNKPNLGELLRAKIEAGIAEEDLSKPYLPQNMTDQQLLELTPFQVYGHIRVGEWTIEDFAAWVYACETYAYAQGVQESGMYD